MAEPRLIVRLKEVRTAAGLTQQELADRAGVSRKTVNTIENRIFTPSVVVAHLGEGAGRAVGRTVRTERLKL